MGRLQFRLNHNKPNQMLVFGERGKPEYLRRNLSEQSGEPKKLSPQMMAGQEIEPGPIVGGS